MPLRLDACAAFEPRGRARSSSASFAAVLVLTALLGSLQSCGGAADDSSALDVRVRFDPLPFIGKSTCHVALLDPTGKPLRGARIDVEGNMNHAGMVPVLATAIELEDGRYSAPFEFTMGGDWILMLHIVLADGTVVDRVFDVPAVPVERDPGMSPDRSRPVER